MNPVFLPFTSPSSLSPYQVSYPFAVQPVSQAVMSLNIQTQLLNSQLSKLAELKQLYIRQTNMNQKPMQQLQFPLGNFTNLVQSSSPFQGLKIQLNHQSNYLSPVKLYNNPRNNSAKDMNKELEKMVKLLLNSIGKNDLNQVKEIKDLYSHNPVLSQVCEKLIYKYCCTRKCKEDIIRYILRKALKTIKAKLCKQEKVHGKKAISLLCKRYFHSRLEVMEKAGLNCENEDELFEFILPYRKNSKNRTMNSQFIEEIFSCEEFCDEYQNFLKDFDAFLHEDNAKKVKKLLEITNLAIKENNFSKLDNFNRLPWLDTWLEDTKKIAVGLLPTQSPQVSQKKVKIELI